MAKQTKVDIPLVYHGEVEGWDGSKFVNGVFYKAFEGLTGEEFWPRILRSFELQFPINPEEGTRILFTMAIEEPNGGQEA